MASSPIAIPFPFTSAPGGKVQEARGRIVNGYWEPQGDPSAGNRICRRAPGLMDFATTAETGYRGSTVIGNTIYSAFSGKLVSHPVGGGAVTVIGTLNGTKKGFFARNNATPSQQMFGDPDGNIATFDAVSVTNGTPDPDLPALNSLCAIDNYFVGTTGDGRAFASDLGANTWNALSFGRADAKQDGLVRGIPYAGRLLLFGNYSLEVFVDEGAVPFPFRRAQVVPRGLAGPYAIAGHEDGFGRDLIFVGDDNGVHRTSDGYQLQKISPPDLDALIEQTTDKTQLEASVYVSRGHPFWQLSTPLWTWVFDLSTETWLIRDSYTELRSRIIGGVYANGKWLCGDTLTGNLLEITASTQTERTTPFRWRTESGPADRFPHSTKVGRADFRFVTGIGMATGAGSIETDPTVEISWSDDGGFQWVAPIQRKLGKQSTQEVVSVVGCGRTGPLGRRWRVDISDPVHVGFIGATMQEDPRVY